jgi:hypothetical protein
VTDHSVHEDAFNLMCGQLLGAGIHRKVFACRIDLNLVVKVEIPNDWRSFANVKEMEFWNEYRDMPKVAKWLAPCEFLSPDGRILLQKRAQPVEAKDLPEKMPNFLTDFKVANFGRIDGQIVCVDYAWHTLKASLRESKVVWGQ